MLPERDRLLIYVQSYDLGARKYECDSAKTQHDKISIVSIPKKNPANAKVVAEPVLFPDGGNDGTTGTLRATTGCHDITVYQAIGLAAGACTGEGVILDIRNPVMKVADERRLTILVSVAGQIRMCDPKLVLASNPQGCK